MQKALFSLVAMSCLLAVSNVHASSMLSNDVGSYQTIGGEQPLLGETLSIASYRNALGVGTFVAGNDDAQFPTYSAVLQYFNNTSQNAPKSSLVTVPKISNPYQSGVVNLPMIIKLSIHSKTLYFAESSFYENPSNQDERKYASVLYTVALNNHGAVPDEADFHTVSLQGLPTLSSYPSYVLWFGDIPTRKGHGINTVVLAEKKAGSQGGEYEIYQQSKRGIWKKQADYHTNIDMEYPYSGFAGVPPRINLVSNGRKTALIFSVRRTKGSQPTSPIVRFVFNKKGMPAASAQWLALPANIGQADPDWVTGLNYVHTSSMDTLFLTLNTAGVYTMPVRKALRNKPKASNWHQVNMGQYNDGTRIFYSAVPAIGSPNPNSIHFMMYPKTGGESQKIVSCDIAQNPKDTSCVEVENSLYMPWAGGTMFTAGTDSFAIYNGRVAIYRHSSN